ncbi:MAG: LodA/GoxA family CTQ-dependent oxidase, partial [Isosphaeraceae bacterium]|nr:LodA/GoxA family CTQ-dependent oxidase [Isosphaeraceae bacterium]
MPMTYEIHPAIGIARLGSSPLSTEEGYFLGPEPGVAPPASYRDSAGYLKRQAARFRIFVCQRDETGTLLDAAEIRIGDIHKITWTVHLVNRKGVARRQFFSGPGFRNQATGDDGTDHSLIIDPGPRSVSAQGERRVFDTGRFRTTPVKLGEICWLSDGRLLVLGGHGRSGSDPEQPRLSNQRGHFVDNDHWFDDTSDGPVVATVELSNGEIVESRAWAVVAPPDFAPGITNLVTLYDLLFDQAVQRGVLKAPTDRDQPLSFTRHIQPILARGMEYRWVNRQTYFGFDDNGKGHGYGSAADFSNLWEVLADPSPAAQARRASIVGALRNPDRRARQPQGGWLIPRLSDAEWARAGVDNVLPLTPTQYKIMQA